MAASSSSTSYLALSTVNVANFVTLKLCGENYSSWKVQMLSLIESHDFLGFIDGTRNPPSNSEEEYGAWRTDTTVRGWILGTVSEPTVLKAVADLTTAEEVWSSLDILFTKPCYPLNKSHQNDLTMDAQAQSALTSIVERLCKSVPNSDSHDGDIRHRAAQRELLMAYCTKAMLMFESYLVKGHEIEILDGIFDNEILLRLKNRQGCTLLHVAAAVGNKPVVEALVENFPNLCFVYDNSGNFPIHHAALHQQKELIQYLLDVDRHDRLPDPCAPAPGLKLFLYLLEARFFDIAMKLVEGHPEIALYKDSDGNSALPCTIALRNRVRLSSWKRVILACLPGPPTFRSRHTQLDGDIESSTSDNNISLENLPMLWRRLGAGVSISCFPDKVIMAIHLLWWKIIGPWLRTLFEKKIVNRDVLELIKLLSGKIRTYPNNNGIFLDAFVKATELHLATQLNEVDKVLADAFRESLSYCCLPSEQPSVLTLVESCRPIVDFIHATSHHKYLYSEPIDSSNNNVLHLAAKLAPSHQLDKITGTALQMHFELKWFNSVEALVHPYARLQRNNMGQTPKMVFMEQHEKLKNDGEKWMKQTANSCTIAAALIATIMFAAAITVPGGTNADKGTPYFANKPLFTLFAISNAASMFASIASLLMFLYILTSRYEVNDFLVILPWTLLIGLASLFFSIAFMMVSFSVSLYFVFGEERVWVLATSMMLAFLPIIVFLKLQFRILWDLYSVFHRTISMY